MTGPGGSGEESGGAVAGGGVSETPGGAGGWAGGSMTGCCSVWNVSSKPSKAVSPSARMPTATHCTARHRKGAGALACVPDGSTCVVERGGGLKSLGMAAAAAISRRAVMAVWVLFFGGCRGVFWVGVVFLWLFEHKQL